MVPRPLSSILTAIYATLNVAGSIGVFRSNQEIPIQWIGSYSFKEEQFGQGMGKGHIPGPGSALGPDVPHADLYVTQARALLIDGVLVLVRHNQ
jgi:hypothetical protein